MNNAERPSDELVERMVGLLREYAANETAIVKRIDGNYRSPVAEARAIVAELPKPIDPDWGEAKKLTQDRASKHSIDFNSTLFYSMEILARDSIKRGRALAKEEAGL